MAAETVPQSGFGTQISWAGHDIGYLLDVGYSGISAETIEDSSHESAWKTFLAGMLDGGEVNIPIRYITGDATGQKQTWAEIKLQTEEEVIITFPDATTMTFNAIITKFGDITMPYEGVMDAVIVLKVTGEPTFSEE